MPSRQLRASRPSQSTLTSASRTAKIAVPMLLDLPLPAVVEDSSVSRRAPCLLLTVMLLMALMIQLPKSKRMGAKLRLRLPTAPSCDSLLKKTYTSSAPLAYSFVRYFLPTRQSSTLSSFMFPPSYKQQSNSLFVGLTCSLRFLTLLGCMVWALSR